MPRARSDAWAATIGRHSPSLRTKLDDGIDGLATGSIITSILPLSIPMPLIPGHLPGNFVPVPGHMPVPRIIFVQAFPAAHQTDRRRRYRQRRRERRQQQQQQQQQQ
ncbi:uncharacterized protein [Temnothorax longispinosus]|uniref:uncharacterized protein n=1 Tax=Temnothorax longispinosus TaxID=300112 RepID=UPI003A9A5D8D